MNFLFLAKTMLSCAIYLLLLLRVFPTRAAPADFILLNCGAQSNLKDTGSRSWDSDVRSRYAPPNAADISSALEASNMGSVSDQVPYKAARVFNSSFTYTFPVLTGPKFLRLYFYSTMYSHYNASLSFFSVIANGFTLLSNFSAFLNSPQPNQGFMKEFVINVQGEQRLNLTFSPNTNSSAFVNGIEIVSIPDGLYYRGMPIKSTNQMYYLENDTALENLHRLNVGGNDVGIQGDSGGMFRAWAQDNHYIMYGDFGYTPHDENLQIKYTRETPSYSAPPTVYTTSRSTANTSISLEWAFPVDSGFNYLLRLHFCEFLVEITAQNQRVFDIVIDNQPADIQADVIYWTGDSGIPIFRDYVAWVPDDGRRGKKDLRLSLIPNLEGKPKYKSAFLNGLEIFKLGDSQQSLAAANPDHPINDSPPPASKTRKKEKSGSLIYAVIGSVIGLLAVVAAVLTFLILRRRRRVKDSLTTAGKSSWVPVSIGSGTTAKTGGSSVPLPSDLCRHFSLEEIKTATGNFDSVFVIGKGGFGNVYKGVIDGGATPVAIKRLNPSSNQGAREFVTEIEMLSKLRHLHLVALIGYCNENGEMILVYDYMEHGTLRDHLYNSENRPLTWKQRLHICLGAAKGLHYLHTGAKHSIIHRDVKSTNILLDENLTAKVSDFGLSKVGPTGGAHTHVSTVVKGSYGYVDPEYYRRQQLTDKSDVYSFGVVLFEVLCARPAIILNLPKEQTNLAEWAKFCCRKGTLEQIVDSNLEGQIAPESLSKFAETAVTCLRDKGIERPAMSDIVWSLEFAIQLQETAEHRGSGGLDIEDAALPLVGRREANTTTDEDMFSGTSHSKSSVLSSDSDKLKTGDIFSEIMNPIGR